MVKVAKKSRPPIESREVGGYSSDAAGLSGPWADCGDGVITLYDLAVGRPRLGNSV